MKVNKTAVILNIFFILHMIQNNYLVTWWWLSEAVTFVDAYIEFMLTLKSQDHSSPLQHTLH